MLLTTGGILWLGYMTYTYQEANDGLETRLKSLEAWKAKIEPQLQKLQSPKGKDTVYTIEIKGKK